jgi:ABC-type Fe3+-siderophore transport system permease subunit
MLMLLSLMLGAVALTPAQVVGVLLNPATDAPAAAIVWNLRLPRVLLACVAGALVGVAALLLARLEPGPVRDPGWSGVASLGALGAVSLLAAAPAQPWWALALAVSAGCGLALAILAVARRRWPRQVGRVHVLGIAVALTVPALAFALLIGDVW